MIDWQPIEMAPRDGSAILLAVEIDAPIGEHNFIVTVRSLHNNNAVPFVIGNLIFYATHWAPITAPITSAGIAAAKWSM